MNKKGFLLIECISAFAILLGVIHCCAYYCWYSLAVQACGVSQLTSTTKLSNLGERLSIYPQSDIQSTHCYPDSTCRLLEQSPLLQGVWALLPPTYYRMYELSIDCKGMHGKPEKLIWYVGYLIS